MGVVYLSERRFQGEDRGVSIKFSFYIDFCDGDVDYIVYYNESIKRISGICKVMLQIGGKKCVVFFQLVDSFVYVGD